MATDASPVTLAPAATDRRLRRVLDELASWGAAKNWIGPDPYEGLNTPAAALLRRSRRGMQAVIQLNRRSPVSPPWPLRASSRPNSKVAGLALSGYAAARATLPDSGSWIERLVDRLAELRLPGDAWGYHFDVQLRHVYYGRDDPNAVATCFAVRGLLDAEATAAGARARDLALGARPFLASLLRDSASGPFYAYVAAGSELIHNSNLMVAGTLARLLAIEPDERLSAEVDAAVETTVGRRDADGLWPYGERTDLTWRDNFHTAYILEGLARAEMAGAGQAELLADATERWLTAFFDARSTASYHPGRLYPADAHSAATAIDTLCVVAEALPAERARLLKRAVAVADRAIELLWLEGEHRFAMQVNARYVNRREYMRWTNAPMFAALARLVSLLPAR